jgi:hypothetical protein
MHRPARTPHTRRAKLPTMRVMAPSRRRSLLVGGLAIASGTMASDAL